jgi:hypothetical protein
MSGTLRFTVGFRCTIEIFVVRTLIAHVLTDMIDSCVLARRAVFLALVRLRTLKKRRCGFLVTNELTRVDVVGKLAQWTCSFTVGRLGSI